MTQTCDVIYNAECPICSREIGAYRAHAEATGAPIRFTPVGAADLTRLGLTEEAATRRLHVVQDGRLLSGVAAFGALWAALPRTRWLARLVALPLVRPAAELVYDRALAPMLYAMHRRRQARADKARQAG